MSGLLTCDSEPVIEWFGKKAGVLEGEVQKRGYLKGCMLKTSVAA